MRAKNVPIGAVLAVAIGAPIVGFVGNINMAQPTDGERTAFFHGPSSSPVAGRPGLASLERANEWINSPPLTASALRGKVVLIDFWTYTCIKLRRARRQASCGRKRVC
jgi:thiol-disulfide isomerase/thioredoxin